MQAQYHQALPAGYRLLDYKIDKVLNSGGFSFVYLARDAQGNAVVIKEYLPEKLASRSGDSRVEANSADTLANFRNGLRRFFEEGRALAHINHRNVVRVLNFFRANDTVYLVMQYERGKTLQEYILLHPHPVKEIFVRRVFGELLNGLREVHTHKLLHLDIKPTNIYLRRDGSPLLLDFGSVRQTLTNNIPRLPSCYTPGFAAPEQYFDRRLLGPWSDIYSVGASIYACLIRGTPISADQRTKKDTLVPATKIGQGVYSQQMLEIVDWCLQLDYLQRPQSVLTLQKALLDQTRSEQPRKKSLLNELRKKLSKAIF
jgi:serine/threonine protein kinase